MSNRLFYYSGNIPARQENQHLPGMKAFASFSRLISPATTIIDRSGTITTPFRTTVYAPIPPLRPSTKSYEDIAHDRVKEIFMRADALNTPLYVMWSGGIDSTMILALLLKQATVAQKKNIIVLMTEESIFENPLFYAEYIQRQLKIESATLFPYILGTKNVMVWGGNNEQLFGPRILRAFIAKYGGDTLHKAFNKDILCDFYSVIKQNDEKGFEVSWGVLEGLIAASPVPIETFFDFFWWMSFSLKWQGSLLRPLTYASSKTAHGVTPEYMKTYFFQFYNTVDFQQWSLNNHDKKIRDSWASYKWPCKEIIYEYTKDARYRDTKLSRDSLQELLLQRSPFLFMDDRFDMEGDVNFSKYFQAKNDFIA